MKDIKEYNAKTSPYELLVHLYDKIQAGELMTFESLLAYTEGIPQSNNMTVLYRKAFELQKRLYWGFFKDISPETFPKVWKEVVVSHRTYPFAGDLKRFMSIPGIYMGMLDIHGYTRFCQENRRNLSMLDLLDRMIQDDIRKLTTKAGVVSRRAAGDQILLLGASAEDLMTAILLIIEYFSKRRRVKDEGGQRPADGSGDVTLPEFQISAGVAGGQKFTPLIITQDGDLSGDIVNTAARLQSRADKISPDRNKILITSHVYQRLKTDGEKPQDQLLAKIDYFNSGTVEFKGTILPVYDTIFIERDGFRLSYREAMEELYDSLDKKMWKGKIFEDALKLITRVTLSLPELIYKEKTESGEVGANKSLILTLAKNAQESFNKENYEEALSELHNLVDMMSKIRCMDELALEYLTGVATNYDEIVAEYLRQLDAEVMEHLDTIYPVKERENFLTLAKHYEMFGRVRDGARVKARNRKAVWFKVSDSLMEDLNIRIQTKK
jgi:class 3 adenylate cyclase